MAATVGAPSVSLGCDPNSPVFHDLVEITGDADYLAGGYAVDALIKAKIGAGRTILNVKPLLPSITIAVVGALIAGYNKATGSVLLYDWTGVETSDHDDCSTYVNIFEVISY